MANGQLNLGKQSGGVLSVSFPDGATNTEVVLPESGNIVSIDNSVTDNAIARYDGTTGKLQDSGVVIDDSGNVVIGGTPNSVSKLQVKTGTNRNISISDQVTISGAITIEAIDDTRGNNIPLEIRGTTISMTGPYGTTCILDTSGNLLLTSGTGALGYGTGAGGTVTQLTSKSTAVTLNKPSGRIIMHNAALAAGASVTFALSNNLLDGLNGDSIIFTKQTIIGSGGGGNYDLKHSINSNGTSVNIILTNISATSQSDALNINFAIVKGAMS